MAGRSRWRSVWCVAAAAVAGCQGPQVVLPTGAVPAPAAAADVHAAVTIAAAPAPQTPSPPETKPGFDLPEGLLGFAPADGRNPSARGDYPQLAAPPPVTPPAAGTLTLADLQHLAAQNSPALRRAAADADAAFGRVVQAGLHPNPTVGYQADQIQPNLRTGTGGSGAGQQGAFVNQLIKTSGKLTLTQKVAGFDYLNAVVAVRRANVDVTAAVRTQYFAALVAQRGATINRDLVALADAVYRLQLKQAAAGQVAGYEPLQLYAQAEQARNALALSEANAKAAWKQLAAAVGQPDLPPTALAGRADSPAPAYDADGLKARVLETHTDVLAARNSIAQAEVNLTLQQKLPVPDLSTNQYHQYDNAAQVYQFGVQVGVQLPLFDRNQGNVRTAQATIAKARENLTATQNDLVGKLAEAQARYDANRAAAERYRDKIIPNLTRAYRALVRRWDVDEPGKVQFGDIVLAQQNLAAAMQAYLAALDAQWRAVVDLANLGQLDDLYPAGPE